MTTLPPPPPTPETAGHAAVQDAVLRLARLADVQDWDALRVVLARLVALVNGTPGADAAPAPTVRELRVVVTTEAFDEAVRFYRDTLAMPEVPAVAAPGGRLAILAAGRATLELADPVQAAFIDAVEVGRRVAGPVRLAFEVADAGAVTRRLEQAGGVVLGEPRPTPFRSTNARLEGPADLQVTLFARDAS